MNMVTIVLSITLLKKSYSIFILFSKLRSQEIDQFNLGIKKVMKFLKSMVRSDIFLKKVKEFKTTSDEKQSSNVNKVRNFDVSFDFLIVYCLILTLSICLFVVIQMMKYTFIRENSLEIKLGYFQIKNIGFNNIYQNLELIKIIDIFKQHRANEPVSQDSIDIFNSLLKKIRQKVYSFQFDPVLPTYKDMIVDVEATSACQYLENTEFACNSTHFDVFMKDAYRSLPINTLILFKTFSKRLEQIDTVTPPPSEALVLETNTIVETLIRMTIIYRSVIEKLNGNIRTLIKRQQSTSKNFVVVEIIFSILMLFFGSTLLFTYLNDLSMENSSFIKVLPFNLIVKNQYFKIYLNKNKY